MPVDPEPIVRASDPMLETHGAGVVYPGGTRALAAANLAVERGETVALVGESGSGKTTLLCLFNRMVEATEGTVRVAGRPVGERDPVELRRGVGYVPQEGGLLPHWTVESNVGLVPQLQGWEPERLRARAHHCLELVGLDPATFAGRYPRTLSGGQRQRVAFARALAADPPVVLLDEPFGALDALTRRDLQREFLHLQRELGKTMLLVTHDLDEAFLLADRVAVLKNGAIRQLAAPEQLRAQPADAYVRALLARATGSER